MAHYLLSFHSVEGEVREHPSLHHGLLHGPDDRGGRRLLLGLQQVDPGQQVGGAAAPGRRHRGDHLVQGRAGGVVEGHGAAAGHGQRDRGRLAGGEVQRWQGVAGVDGVAAARAGGRPDGHAGRIGAASGLSATPRH